MSAHSEHLKSGEFKRTCKQCLIRRIREISAYYGAKKGENYRVSDEILTRDGLEGLLDYLCQQAEESQRQERLRANMERFYGREPEPRVENEEDRLNRQLRKMAENERMRGIRNCGEPRLDGRPEQGILGRSLQNYRASGE